MADIQEGLSEAIKRSVVESFKNLDPVGLMQQIVSSDVDDEESAEIKEKLQGVLQKYNQMTDEERTSFVDQMKDVLATKISAKLGQQDLKLDGLQEAIGQAVMTRLIILGVGVVLLVFLFVFFGYKLYKSIKDKELKREEKKKLKEMKKKK